MQPSTYNSLVGKWGQRWFAIVGKNPSHAALNMNHLLAFVHSTDVGNSRFTSKRTQLHVAFAKTVVIWMICEQHVDYRIGITLIGFAWKSCGNCTAIECWPAIEPKPSSEQVVYVGEHPICHMKHWVIPVKKKRPIQRRAGDDFPRGQLQLVSSGWRPMLAGICTKTRSRCSRKHRQAPCVAVAWGAAVLGRSRMAFGLDAWIDMDGWIALLCSTPAALVACCLCKMQGCGLWTRPRKLPGANFVPGNFKGSNRSCGAN